MKETRRSFLRNASALSALAIGASASASAANCSGVAEWDASATYTGGDQVTFDGQLWTAEWWTQGTEPAESENVWTLEGACGDDGDSGDSGSGVDCSGVQSWTSDVAYSGGDQVTFDGSLWTAEWWTEGTEPAESEDVWTLEGACNGDGGDENTAPTASFSADVSTPEPGDSISFDASESSDPDGSIDSYEWEFGDGTTATGETVSHSYDSAGDYTVTLTVTDDAGATATDSTTISVSSGNAAPDASFTVSPSNPAPDESVSFDAADSSDSDGTIASYEWELGDGTTATGESVSHSYESAGDYTVSLTVTDDAGASDTNETVVSVGDSSGGTEGSTEFAPYNYVFTDPETTLVDHAEQAGNDSVTTAFVLSDGNGNAAWGGEVDQLVGEAGLKSEFQAYQDQGGTIIISFGGAVGTMIAQDTTDIEKIKSEYQSVIDTYGVTHLDFDIESVDEAAVDRRNQALAELQSENPDLKVSYTLRCRTTGLTEHGTYVVENARDNGVDVQYVNVMTMNYGWVRPSASTVKDTANGTHEDLLSIFSDLSSDEAWSMVGITPMIGENNVGGQHRPEDAEEVVSFVEDKGIGLVSFWSLDRDNGDCPDGTVSGKCSGIEQSAYEFAGIYNQVQ
ncbi:PKD domain-containing protein [Halomicrobium mukohataei]|uniref:PKD domain-containing protein n=1 Tax=Halomicrobium mukohataei TaxID=57705 RepID=A0A847UIS3_9EURY|nr:PKD domain-containing protein [Halomicrobium mukohataei]NLV11241.1 PKD domain-containing protein [Halomicrobium mukohataei]